VQNNVRAFGGDRNRVTLLGQSSGGTSIFGHLSSPGARGLFAGAISLSGSPNMSISLHDAEFQHRQDYLTRTPCYTATNVLTCLYGLSADQVVAGYPPDWGGLPIFPSDPTGNHQPGLLILDGVTVTMSYASALALPLIDVPLIISTNRDEFDLLNNDTINAMTPDQFAALIRQNFAPWDPAHPNRVGDAMLALYNTHEERIDPRKHFVDMASDTTFNAGNAFLAVTAAKAFNSPVYLSIVNQPPGEPIPNPFGGVMIWPGHSYDWQQGFQIYEVPFGEVVAPEFYSYTPSASDNAVGSILRGEWFQFIQLGHILPGSHFQAVDDVAGFPDNYNVGVIADNQRSTVVNFDVRQYDGLNALGIDDRFWIVN